MRNTFADLKLLGAGIGLGALICSALVGKPAAHVCGTVAIVAVMLAVVFRFVEAWVPHKHPQQTPDAYDWTDEDPGTCATCGQPWELVRPGKSQPTCDC